MTVTNERYTGYAPESIMTDLGIDGFVPAADPSSATDHRPPIEIAVELKGVFDPLGKAMASSSRPDAILADNPELIDKVMEQPIYRLNFGHQFRRLPWDVALGADLSPIPELQKAVHTAEPGTALDMAIANKRAFVTGLIENYAERHPEVSDHGHPNSPEVLRSSIDYCFFDFDNPFDAEEWKEHERFIESLAPEEQEMVGLSNDIRGWLSHQARIDAPGLRHYEEFLLLKNNYSNTIKEITHMIMPIGEYGVEFAEAVLRAIALMQASADVSVRDLAYDLTVGHEDTLRHHTARAADKAEGSEETTMDTAQEAHISVMQAVAWLTAEKVEGYDDPIDLLEVIVISGNIERLARYLPMGFIGPMNMQGAYIEGGSVPTEDSVKFGDKFEAYLRERRAAYVEKLMKDADHPDGDEKGFKLLGRVCVGSGRNGAIQALAYTLVDMLRSPII
jgi:hypothetical protein